MFFRGRPILRQSAKVKCKTEVRMRQSAKPKCENEVCAGVTDLSTGYPQVCAQRDICPFFSTQRDICPLLCEPDAAIVSTYYH